MVHTRIYDIFNVCIYTRVLNMSITWILKLLDYKIVKTLKKKIFAISNLTIFEFLFFWILDF